MRNHTQGIIGEYGDERQVVRSHLASVVADVRAWIEVCRLRIEVIVTAGVHGESESSQWQDVDGKTS